MKPTKAEEVRAEDIKLSAKHNFIIWCLQNGWELITNNEMRGATCANEHYQFQISHTVFWNIHDKGLIWQNIETNFYELTPLGKKVKTRPVKF